MKTAVVTLSVGDQGRDMLEISRPSIKAYADRIGAAFHVFRVAASDYPCGEKFRVRDAVAHYDRTIYLDADCIVSPTCPSLFDVVPVGHVGGYNDAGSGYEVEAGVLGLAQAESNVLCDSQGRERRHIGKAYNSGVLVLDREHAGFFDPPSKPFPRSHCMEQWWEWLNVLEYGYRTFDLPDVFNFQWWFGWRMPTIRERPDIQIRHFSAMTHWSNHANRLAAMRSAVRDAERCGAPMAVAPLRTGDYESPGMEPPRPDAAFPNMAEGDPSACGWKHLRQGLPHNWYVDRRFPTVGFISRDEAAILHADAKLFAGKPALEVGCWMGWSTCHIAIAGVSHLDVVDPILADPVFLQSVSDSLAEAAVAGSVSLFAEPSPAAVERLSKRHCSDRWAFAFIDSDHDGEAPTRDALAFAAYAAGTAMVLFHDAVAPSVGAALDALARQGWQTAYYHTAQIMGVAWRGDVAPVPHTPDPAVSWSTPPHLARHRAMGPMGPMGGRTNG